MRPNDGSHRIRELHTLQNLGANYGMDLHLLELFGRELARLRNDRVGHGQLANIVQDRSGLQRL